MQRYADWYRDSEGRGYPGAVVTVYNVGTTSKPQLYNAGGDLNSPAPISNPTYTDPNGYFAFAIPNGTYDIHLQGGGMPVTIIPNKTIGTTDITSIPASAVTVTPVGTISATNTQAALAELDTDITNLTASEIANVPAGTISATDVQAAIDELDTEKLAVTAARERLVADRTYYVRTDGSDSNTGLANTAGGAFLTIQKACDVVGTSIDANGYNVTIQVGDGTYTAQTIPKPVLGVLTFTIQGNASTPSNVLVSVTSTTAFFVSVPGTNVTIKDMEIRTTTSGNCINAIQQTAVMFSNIKFGACAGSHLFASRGGYIQSAGNYEISGGATTGHAIATSEAGILRIISITITITGTPAFGTFASTSNCSIINIAGVTFSGSATGKRYNAINNSVIGTGGGGATYLPGDVAGTTATGGQYV